jgi:hypothetical protein
VREVREATQPRHRFGCGLIRLTVTVTVTRPNDGEHRETRNRQR